jgi:hypothetical protein
MCVTLREVRAVRIVCDDFLRKNLLEQLSRFGATGYTWWQAHRKGEHPTDSGILSELRRICVEIWCSQEVADKILSHCQSNQFRHSGMAVGVTSLLIPEDEAAKFTAK